MALAIFGACIALSIAISILSPRAGLSGILQDYIEDGPRDGERRLVEHLREHPEDREAWLALVRMRSMLLGTGLPRIPAAGERFGPGLESELSMHPRVGHLDDAAFDAFLATCPVFPPDILRARRDAHRFPLALLHLTRHGDSLEAQLTGGELCLEHEQPAQAIAWFERARALSRDDRRAVTGWLQALHGAAREAELAAALADPEIRAAADPRALFDIHQERSEAVRGLIPLWRSEYAERSAGLWLVVLATGACWGLLIFHLGHGWAWGRASQCLVPAAIALGWVSADATLGAVVLMDEWMGTEHRDGLAFSMLHALAIGVREELLKLLLFLPLVPFLVRRGSDIQGFVLASLVGLGFAMNENSNYFLASGGSEIFGRYLTANFAHMAMTGYAGLYLFRAVRRGAEGHAEFLQALVQVILVHALYDLFILADELREYTILSMVIFILISQQYLRLIFRVRPHRVQRVSATRIFVAALATVAGMHYLYLSTQVGIREALWQTLGELLGIAILTVMYFREFDERVA
jgi:RsiW-degrading membrane proteinase PrsW (M82 family)